MELAYTLRSPQQNNRRLRRNQLVPAVLYQKGESVSIAFQANEFQSLLRSVPKGRLSTVRFTLKDENGVVCQALVKEIQYHPTTYAIQHIDFIKLSDDVPVRVRVPIELTGAPDCVGVKAGGVLRQVINKVKVECLARDIPSVFLLDVTTLGMKETRRLSDLEMPQTVRPLTNLSEVAVVVAKR